MRKPTQRITLKDIADDCGFSVNTVSRALRDDPRLSGATVETIKKSARSLGYIRNVLASSLRSGKSGVIAILIEQIQNPHYSNLISELTSVLSDRGYNTMVLITQDDPDREKKMLDMAVSHSVDGILFFPHGPNLTAVQMLRESRIPFVMIDRHVEGVRDVDVVRLDDEQGGYIAAKELLSKGHRHILYIAGPLYSSSQVDRAAGIRRAILEEGFDPVKIIRSIRWERFQEAIRSDLVLDLLNPVDYTAILSFNDEMAYYAMAPLIKTGYRFPEDLSVCGFDFVRGIIPYLPRLTSVTQAKRNDLSSTAAEVLLKRISHTDFPPRDVCLPVTLIDDCSIRQIP